jgi:DNA-binding response OmpR family regulator
MPSGAKVVQAQTSGRKKVMIVEDDADYCSLVRMMLDSRDLETIAAEDGHRALEAIRRLPPDLVILDLILPDMNGWELFIAMRDEAASQRIPVIILSGMGTRLDRSFGVRVAQVHDYLVKPCLPSQLRASVAAALQN